MIQVQGGLHNMLSRCLLIFTGGTHYLMATPGMGADQDNSLISYMEKPFMQSESLESTVWGLGKARMTRNDSNLKHTD